MSPEDYIQVLTTGLQLAGIGMGVVFVALVAITFIVSNFERIEHLIHGSKPEKEAVVEKKEPLPSSMPDGISPEIIAAISAAINEAISKKVRVTRIRYRQRPAPTWHVQGRATIMNRRHE